MNNSKSSLEWSRFHSIAKKKENTSALDLKDAPFVSDFPSPNDEISKKNLKSSESLKSEKKKRFSYTSENWIG